MPSSRASMADIAAILVSGKSIQHRLTAAEGLTSDMIYTISPPIPCCKAMPAPSRAEGTLLPETYLFTRGTTRSGNPCAHARAPSRNFLPRNGPPRTPACRCDRPKRR